MRTERRTDMIKLKDAFRNFAKGPRNLKKFEVEICLHLLNFGAYKICFPEQFFIIKISWKCNTFLGEMLFCSKRFVITRE